MKHLPWLLMLTAAAAVAGVTAVIAEPESSPPVPAPPPDRESIEQQKPLLRRRAPGAPVTAPLKLTTGRPSADAPFDAARERMVAEQLAAPGRGITNESVLKAMRAVPRHQYLFTPLLADAYEDKPLIAGYDRTMESPFVVASVAELLDPKPTDRILTVATDTGYQATVLALLAKEVYSVDPFGAFVERAQTNFLRLGYGTNLFVRKGSVAEGWPEAAPFDAIVLNGSLDDATEPLLAQLKDGGRLIIPVAEDGRLHVYQKNGRQLVQMTTRNACPPPAPGNRVDRVPLQRIMRVQPK